MAQAKNGDKVKIDYTGKLEDGTIFDSTIEGECPPDECDSDDCDDECDDDGCGCGVHESGPMELTIGEGELFSQVDEALVGMAPGDKKSVVIPAADAFSEYDK
jgi:peptidylprolyl isomerase